MNKNTIFSVKSFLFDKLVYVLNRMFYKFISNEKITYFTNDGCFQLYDYFL